MGDSLIESMLKQLKLSSISKQYQALAAEAIKMGKSHEEYLKVLLEEELGHRLAARIKTLIVYARFPAIKTLAEFQFDALPKLNKQKILDLSDGHFIEGKSNICFLGQTGTGKTHLAIALAYEACKKKHKVLFYSAAKLVNQLIEARTTQSLSKLQKKLQQANLIVLDELGYIPFSKEGAELLFQFFSDRYEQGSLIVTTNLEFSDWTKFLGDPTMTSALLDRFTHHCDIFTLNGESYRFRQRKKQ